MPEDIAEFLERKYAYLVDLGEHFYASGLDIAAKEILDLRIKNLLLERRLEVVSIIAVGADVVETSESAVKKIGIICPPNLGQPDARWPEIPFEWLAKG